MRLQAVGNKLIVRIPYDPPLIYRIKQIQGRVWNPTSKVWEVPYTKPNLQYLGNLGFDTSFAEQQNLKETLQTELKSRYKFLFEHQISGATRAILSQRLLVADACGLGKTNIGGVVMDYFLSNHYIAKCLVVCPHSIKWQWQAEIKKFFNVIATIVEGNAKQRKDIYNNNHNVLIVNYEQLLRDIQHIYRFVHNQLLIFDEATYVKNPKAKRTSLLKRLEPKYIFGISGLPIETKLEDVFTILNIIQPGWMSRKEFYTNYCNFGYNYGYYQILSYKNVHDFMKRVYEITIRRTHQDVANSLPTKVIYTRMVEPTVYQKQLCTLITKSIREDYKQKLLTSTIQKFVLLQMAEDSTELVRQSNAMSLRNVEVDKIESAKLIELKHILEELEDTKIIVFTKFKRMAFLLEKLLPDCIVGVGGSDKAFVINEFKNNKRFLVATDAYAYGVDLPFVTTIINFDIPWNPAKLQQRIDRCYRLTSKSQLKVFNLVSSGFEKYIYQKMSEKQQLGEMFNVKRTLEQYILEE